MSDEEQRQRTIAALEGLAAAAGAAAPVSGVAAPGVAAAGIILHTVATQMRLHGKSVEEILQAIEMPKALALDEFRKEVDTSVQKKPSRKDP